MLDIKTFIYLIHHPLVNNGCTDVILAALSSPIWSPLAVWIILKLQYGSQTIHPHFVCAATFLSFFFFFWGLHYCIPNQHFYLTKKERLLWILLTLEIHRPTKNCFVFFHTQAANYTLFGCFQTWSLKEDSDRWLCVFMYQECECWKRTQTPLKQTVVRPP